MTGAKPATSALASPASIDPALLGKAAEAHERYYPTHTARLLQIKEKYDPERVFNFPQDF